MTHTTPRTLGIIQASYDSLHPRFPWSRRLGGRPWLEWVLGRLSDCTWVRDWVLLTPLGVADAWQEAAPAALQFVPCRGDDALQSVVERAEAAGAEGVVRACADHPLIDAALIDSLVAAAVRSETDYAAYVTADGRPAVLHRLGLSVEWASLAALKRCEKTAPASDRVDFMASVRGRPDEFDIRLVTAPNGYDAEAPLAKRSLAEQWEDMDDLLEAHLPNDAPTWAGVSALLGDGR